MTLPAQFDIRVVQEVCARLRAGLATGHPLRLDASEVAATDTAALQLLVVARRSAQARSIRFEWLGVSSALKATGAQLGLSALLGLGEADRSPGEIA